MITKLKAIKYIHDLQIKEAVFKMGLICANSIISCDDIFIRFSNENKRCQTFLCQQYISLHGQYETCTRLSKYSRMQNIDDDKVQRTRGEN